MARRHGDRRRAKAAAAAAPAFVGWGGRLWSPGLARRIGEGLRAAWLHEVESRRLFPWIAVAYGSGILLAFAADGPLSPWPPFLAAAASGTGAWLGRARLGRLAALVGATASFLGFAAATLRMEAVEAPVLQRLTTARLAGFVEAVEERASGGGRLVLRLTALDKVAEAERPSRVRVTVRSLDAIAAGDHVAGAARLLPPPEAARPGGYDFARDAYFRGLGAVGSVSGRLAAAAPAAPPDGGLRVAALVDRARNALTARIAASVGGQAGAVAAALVTGKRGLIDERTNDVLRAAGIYHVVSISGLHMVLAAGLFFAATRALLALSPALALGWPIKKLAALVGMAGATAYCVFSGSEIATERSLVMILVMQGAILFDRPALSMRNLALSALLVLTREPEAVLGPSFQMSYAAVAGLIALAEASRRFRPTVEGTDPVGRAGLWLATIVVGTVATTLVATLATGPFGAYHFQNLQPYGLIGNAATLPLVSFAVMPAAVLGVVALPFGLDRPVWSTMGWAVEAVLRLSEWVATFPNSIVIVPAYGAGALLLLAFAILCTTLFASRLKLLAIAPAILGFALAAAPVRPDVYVARDGSGAALRGRDGRLVVVGRVAAFTVEQWLRADGDARKAADPTLREGVRCDRIGCTAALADGRAVSHLSDRRGFGEDCGRASVTVSRLPAPAGCAAELVADAAFLARHGAATLSVRPSGGFAVAGVRREGDDRPWLVRRPPAARPAREVPSVRPAQPAPEPEEVPSDPPDLDATP